MCCTGLLYLVKIRIIYVRAALLSEKREASSSSLHGGEGECPLRSYCKFEINLRLFAIWLVTMKYITALKTRNSKFGLPWYLRREKPALPHNMVMQLDVHSVCIANLKSTQDHLLSG